MQISLRFLPISKTKATNKCCKFLKCTCLGLQKLREYISISISELASEVKSTETLKSWTSYKQSGSVFYIAWQYFGNALQLFLYCRMFRWLVYFLALLFFNSDLWCKLCDNVFIVWWCLLCMTDNKSKTCKGIRDHSRWCRMPHCFNF